jgi:hypothetical protein
MVDGRSGNVVQISQGSAVLDYDIFLNLEVADSQELFRSDANSGLYGLIRQAANSRTNPDALPISLTKTVVAQGRWKGEYIGLTCAACHTAQLTYRGKKIRIDGGVANTFDLMAYIHALDDALQATLTDTAKFNRLAVRLGASTSNAKIELRNRFASEAERAHESHLGRVNSSEPKMGSLTIRPGLILASDRLVRTMGASFPIVEKEV